MKRQLCFIIAILLGRILRRKLKRIAEKREEEDRNRERVEQQRREQRYRSYRVKKWIAESEMALVAYGSSDESDTEQDDLSVSSGNSSRNAIPSTSTIKPNGKYESNKPSIDDEEPETIVRPSRPISRRNAEDDSDSDEDEVNLEPLSFSQKLSSATCHTVADESRIPKSSRLNALFSLSTQLQTKISEGPVKKKLGAIQEKSGLLSVLPTPSSEVFKSPAANAENLPSKALPSKLIPRSIKTNSKTLQKGVNDEDEEIEGDFFSLTKVDSTPDVFEPIDIDSLKSTYGLASKTPTVAQSERISETLPAEDGAVYENMDCEDSVGMSGSNDVALDEDALQKLCGRKRKGQTPDEIQLIDVFEDKILAESKEERLKRLSEEVSYRPAVKRGTGPSTLEKRKHQITYLASLAKSRELDLKNMWAQNKFTKRQTQSKYGF